MQKGQQEKHKRFLKMPPILMYWFAAQQQTCTLRPQKYGSFYVKFSAEFNGCGLFFQKQKEVAIKWIKRK